MKFEKFLRSISIFSISLDIFVKDESNKIAIRSSAINWHGILCITFDLSILKKSCPDIVLTQYSLSYARRFAVYHQETRDNYQEKTDVSLGEHHRDRQGFPETRDYDSGSVTGRFRLKCESRNDLGNQGFGPL